MSDYDFNQMVQKIRSQWIGKMNTAKEGVNNNYLNTYQVRQILQIFSTLSEGIGRLKAFLQKCCRPAKFQTVVRPIFLPITNRVGQIYKRLQVLINYTH